MLYGEFINKAMELTIEQADNGLFYLDPMWRNILADNKLGVKNISDTKTTIDNVFETLKLEVEKRNIENSKRPYVLDWLYEIITAHVDPAMLAEETDYIKQVTEFMKANHEIQELSDKQ